MMQLVCASLSSTASYSIPENWENQFYFHITVDTGTKRLSNADELWGFQILSLFGIYVKELMEIEITAVEFGAEKKQYRT
ncbi:MAG: hypothetical protein IPO72_11995 [Saprospiraceae bacterium]|nr:hypothetical protein [Candidatus Vicinibacter affinis]